MSRSNDPRPLRPRMGILDRLNWVFHSGTAISKRRHFKSHKRVAFRFDVREDKARRSKKRQAWARVDVEEARALNRQ